MLFCVILVHILHYALGQVNKASYVQSRFLFPFGNERVDFILHTSPTTKLNISNADLESIGNGGPFKFLVHGWTESLSSQYYKYLTEAFFRKGTYNIVHIDWSSLSKTEYMLATVNAVTAGEKVGNFIVRLINESSIDPDTIQILGHSLGAHVAGIAGETIFKLIGRKIGRITGLDPAGPLYEGLLGIAKEKINKDCANMVDIVHTDGGLFGCIKPMGTIDFYVNGGTALQPGCLDKVTPKNILETISRWPVEPLPLTLCSHRKSHKFYKKALDLGNITAVKCSSWEDFKDDKCVDNEVIPFGEDTPPSASGIYYLSIR